MKKYTNQEIIHEFEIFCQDKESLIISTTNEDKSPLTNYSPFVEKNDCFYICVSSLLPHYENIVRDKKAHVFIIEDESKASHVYARKRLYFDVVCETVNKEEEIFQLFDKKYKDKLSFLRSMKDFKILKLLPEEKSLVLGFGAAYILNNEGKISQKTISHKN
jgi:hypothetical protein